MVTTTEHTKDGDTGKLMHWWWCPGCEETHIYWTQIPGEPVTPGNVWSYDGNEDAPTFSPSLLNHGGRGKTSEHVCHLFITQGVIEFLGDCTHALAGQKVPMPTLPDWLARIE